MGKCSIIKVEKLRVADVIGTTSMAPWSWPIKGKTWGWWYMFDQSKDNHIAIVNEEHTLFYFMEMLGKGIHQTDIDEYDHRKPLQHICFVGRHKAFDDPALRQKYNDYMLELHARHIKYGWDDIAQFILDGTGIKIHDKESTLICNELPKAGFKYCGVPYPTAWDTKLFSPKDWQVWQDPMFQNITAQIIG